jgi:hypothetical protein
VVKSGSALTLQTNGSTTAVTIDTSQNVGIGTTSPGSLLELKAALPYLRLNGTTGNGNRGIQFQLNGTTYGSINQNATTGETSISCGENSSDFFLIFKTGNGTERMRIDPAGRVTIPYQPSFHVRVNNGSYLTTSPIPFSNSVFDVGSNFNTSTYRFTAPIAGKYYFVLNMYLVCVNGADAYPRFRVNGSNRQYSYFFNNGAGGAIDTTTSVNAIFNLSVGDYVDVTFNGGGTYYGGNQETNFYGYLLG